MSKNLGFKIVKMIEKDANSVKDLERENGLSPWSVSDYKVETNRPDSVCLVARNTGNDVVGFGISRMIISNQSGFALPNKDLDFAEIYNICVSDAFRGIGVGSSIVRRIFKEFDSKRIPTIWLNVRKRNIGAIRFYKNHGFRKAYVRKNFYLNPVSDSIVMKLNSYNEK